MKKLKNPIWLMQSADLFREYPQEALSALLDHPAAYLRKFDDLCRTAPHTGVAANDAHQNVGVVVKLLDDGNALIADALDKVTSFRPTIIVTDLVMPRMSGIELLKALQPELEHIRVILLTAHADTTKDATLAREMADAYLTKPFSPKQLLETVHWLVS